MFREMRRIKQQITEAECIEVLKTGRRGVLSVLGDDDYPYGIPVDYIYDEETGNLYFHGAPTGHRIDAVTKHDKVCFTVFDNEEFREGDWAAWVRSVIVFGRIKVIADREKRLSVTRRIGLKYYPTAEAVDEILNRTADRVAALELCVEHMTGKLVHEE